MPCRYLVGVELACDLTQTLAAGVPGPDPFDDAGSERGRRPGLGLGFACARASRRRSASKRCSSSTGISRAPLFPSVGVALRELAARAVERDLYAPDELVFATIRGTPLHESNLNRRVWRPALERAGLAHVGYRFHDLRHTCVSRLVSAGADVKLVQAVAGHASPLITLQRYSHLLDSRISEAADRFDPARVL